MISIGQIFCPTDTDEFLARCQIPLFQNQWNRWLLWRTLDDDPERETLRIYGMNAMHFWFFGSAAIPGITSGNVRNLQILVTPEELEVELRGQIATSRATQFGCTPQLKKGPFAPVVAKFIYTGSQLTMNWPVRKVSYIPGPGLLPIPIITQCPVDADWILDTVYSPIPGELIPPVSTISDVLPDFDAESVLKEIEKSLNRQTEQAKTILTPLLIGVGAVAALIIILRFGSGGSNLISAAESRLKKE